MKKEHFFAWGVLLLIIGCAAVEPTRIEDGLYVNPAYQFSVRVPSGWEVSEEIPEFLKKDMSLVNRQKFKATFYDLKNKRFILVSAEKTEAGWVSFKMYSDKFISSLQNLFAGQKRKYLKKPEWHDYRYEIYEDRIENCESQCVAAKVDFHVQDLMATGHNIVYKSDYGMVYTVSLALIARVDQYAPGLEVYEAVLDSFQHR